jgi:hypothetical protein
MTTTRLRPGAVRSAQRGGEEVAHRRDPDRRGALPGVQGRLFLSHVNDAGFWLVKESFGLTVGQTFKSWSVSTPSWLAIRVLRIDLIGQCSRDIAGS